jgi:cupin superfamily acireductone dioxygenase involved in methionine salvage
MPDVLLFGLTKKKNIIHELSINWGQGLKQHPRNIKHWFSITVLPYMLATVQRMFLIF